MKPLLRLACITASLLAIMPIAAFACPAQPDPPFKQIGTQSYDVALKTIPEEIVVGKPFSVDLWIGDKTGSAFEGEIIAGATMPLHKHGMNYKPSISSLGDGKYRLEGFVFHMQGQWQFLFDLREGGHSETVSLDHVLK
ncbi:MAG: hypothetical protein V7701_12095 [Sneathiella sp.]